MENNNGRGIFYGVIGVATLVVAIIGATFAYFSASITSNGIGPINSTVLTLQIMNETTNFKTDMVPVDAEDNGDVFKDFPGLTSDTTTHMCKDLVNNSICSVYQFTVFNPSTTTAQTVQGRLKVLTNTGFTNLKYAVFKGTSAQVVSSTNKFDIDTDPAVTTVRTQNGTVQTDSPWGTVVVGPTNFDSVDKVYTSGQTDPNQWTNTVETLEPQESTTYTLIMWLEEAGSLNDPEQGKSMTAGITFSSLEGAGVTGVLTTSAG